jgi:hypothetical protein
VKERRVDGTDQLAQRDRFPTLAYRRPDQHDDVTMGRRRAWRFSWSVLAALGCACAESSREAEAPVDTGSVAGKPAIVAGAAGKSGSAAGKSGSGAAGAGAEARGPSSGTAGTSAARAGTAAIEPGSDGGGGRGGGQGRDGSAEESDAGGVDEPVDAGPPPSTAVYSATRYSGAYDHLHLYKRDDERGYCVHVALTLPSPSYPPSPVEVPPPWGLAPVSARSPVGACEQSTEMATYTMATAISGYVRFGETDTSLFPCTVDVDLELTLQAVDGIPTSDRFVLKDFETPCDPWLSTP